MKKATKIERFALCFVRGFKDTNEINEKGLTQTMWYAIFDKSGIITEMCALSEEANGNSTLHCIDGDEYQKLYSID